MNIKREYFEWMCNQVCSDEDILSYSKLLKFLHAQEFHYILHLDRDRLSDGIDFRYRFGYENGYDRNYISNNLNTSSCSVLEMMVALAFRVEEQIMDDTHYGNRTGQWFWNMIVSLNLGGMDDKHFDRAYCRERIYILNNRLYNSNGEGGLFTVNEPEYDMRDATIWCQCMWYLDENFDFSI